jgi:hypothetical protein
VFVLSLIGAILIVRKRPDAQCFCSSTRGSCFWRHEQFSRPIDAAIVQPAPQSRTPSRSDDSAPQPAVRESAFAPHWERPTNFPLAEALVLSNAGNLRWLRGACTAVNKERKEPGSTLSPDCLPLFARYACFGEHTRKGSDGGSPAPAVDGEHEAFRDR